jgi:two-component system, cell cycle sensor histidine kinase and response regulator CckA
MPLACEERLRKTMSQLKQDSRRPPFPPRTILIVDDEAKMRAVLSLWLTRHGFAVLEADSGEEALRICKDSEEPIHLLLVDVVMPGMSGVELAPQIMALRPDMKVILMSGYRDDQVFLNAALNPNTPFFHKPFTFEALIEKVQELLTPPR